MIAFPVPHIRASQCVLILWVLLILACPSGAEQPIPKSRGPVNDFAQVLSPAYEKKMAAITRELLQKTGIPVVVVTMPDIGGAEYNDYANRLYEAWGIGKKGEDKGVLIFVTVKERKMRIEVGYGLEGVIPDGLAGEIRDQYMIPYLRKNQYNEGLLNGVLGITQVIARSAGVKITGQTAVSAPRKKKTRLSFFPILLIFIVFMIFSRRRQGSWIIFPLLMGGGLGSRGGGGFGGFSGGFGGFGGGMSGGGGAGGGF